MAFDEQNEEADKALKECHSTLRFLKHFKIYDISTHCF